MKRFGVVSFLVVLAMVLAACAPAAPTAAPMEPTAPLPTQVPPEPTAMPEPEMMGKTIVDVAVEDGRFTTLVTAVQAADLVETLSGEGPFTVFAPTDDVFAKLPEGTIDALLGDIPQLSKILTYHVAPGKLMAADVVGATLIETAAGIPLKVMVDGDKVFINDAQVIITDVEASNGVIHVIDSVILPPASIAEIATADGRFNTLVAALGAAGLAETLSGEGSFTVFAPTDDAFAKLPAGTVEALLGDIPALKDILLYHVVDGAKGSAEVLASPIQTSLLGNALFVKAEDGKAMINNAEIIITDIVASNGIIHVIDTVLLPMDIVDTAVMAGNFETLAAALGAADLVDTLKGEGPFTVFAPTDEAFAKLPEGTVEGLLADIPALTNILTYHVVAGKVMAADVVGLESADSVQGSPIAIKVDGDKVFVNEAQVILTDIVATNGVIHVIDSVILPPAE